MARVEETFVVPNNSMQELLMEMDQAGVFDFLQQATEGEKEEIHQEMLALGLSDVAVHPDREVCFRILAEDCRVNGAGPEVVEACEDACE